MLLASLPLPPSTSAARARLGSQLHPNLYCPFLAWALFIVRILSERRLSAKRKLKLVWGGTITSLWPSFAYTVTKSRMKECEELWVQQHILSCWSQSQVFWGRIWVRLGEFEPTYLNLIRLIRNKRSGQMQNPWCDGPTFLINASHVIIEHTV